MNYNDLLKLKKINGLVLELGSVITFRVKKMTGTRQVEGSKNEWEDCDCVQLEGKWNGYPVMSDVIFNQKDLDSLEQNITFLNNKR